MKRKRKHGDHQNHERWLVSYADFITLLFAFFVVMYALAMQDMAKVKAAAESIRQALGGSPGYSTGSGSRVSPMDLPGPPGTQQKGLPADGAPGAGASAVSTDAELTQMRELIQETLALETGMLDLADHLDMVQDRRGLVVRIAAESLYGKGETEVRADFRPILDRIGRVVASTRRNVSVEGHTDPSEAQGGRAAGGARGAVGGDWELSSARAAWVARYWIARFGIAPERLSVAGFAHFRPLSKGNNEWARGKNRRIEIIIQPAQN